MAKRETKTQWEVGFEDEHKRFMDQYAVLCTKDFSDSEDLNPKPIAALQGGAERYIEELARQIHRCCSDKKWNSFQKRVACEQLVMLAILSTESLYRLAREFPESFRQIAEECPRFPCLFPAHAEELTSLKKIMWDELNLGKRHALKLRTAPGRKTFSMKTWANKLLIDLIQVVHELAREESERDPGEKHGSTFRDVAYRVPLTPQNAKQWLDVIFELLLIVIPNPEKHPILRKLGDSPSRRRKGMDLYERVGEKTQASNVRASIKAKLGVYLERMLNEQAVHK
jgi:hypothetical protein